MIIFLHIPKTGGTSFRFILENTFSLSNCHTNQTKQRVFGQSDLNFARKVFPKLRSLAGHNLIDPLQLAVTDPFHMTFLREPVARVISHYQDGVQRGHDRRTFEEVLQARENLENLHVKLMAGERNLDKAKRYLEKCRFIGLTEKFDLSLHVLKRLCPYPLNLHYKRKVVARDNTVKKQIQSDPRLLELAREYNQLDLELYAFAVNEVFPKLCAQAGLNPADPVNSFETYTSVIKPKYLLGRFYNKIFRELCKRRAATAVSRE